MSKKKTKKQPQLLSPEKYIRQKSKNLPLYKCFITENWEDSLLAQIVIAREHAGGSLSLCIYMVDLGCLGVKDTYYSVNVSPAKYEEIIGEDHQEISYPLAHNIIYAAIEFAEEYGFKPHKDFTQITSYFLEDDTDNIPLMEIPCGGKEDGKPFYINTGYESPAQAKLILNRLSKTAGEGNYHYLLSVDDDGNEDDYEDEDDYDDDYDEEETRLKEEYSRMSGEELFGLFLYLTTKIQDKEDLSKDEAIQLMLLTDALSLTIVDEETLDMERQKIEQHFDHPIVETETFPNSLFDGLTGETLEIAPALFDETYNAINQDTAAEEALNTFREKVGEHPSACFLELFYEQQKNSGTYARKLEEAFAEYPGYLLIQILWTAYLIEDEAENPELFSESYETLLTKTKLPVTDFELNVFAIHYPSAFLLENWDNTKTIIAKIYSLRKFLFENQWIYEDPAIKMNGILTRLQISALIAWNEGE